MRIYLSFSLILLASLAVHCQSSKSSTQINMPITEEWLLSNLKQGSPRLIMQEEQVPQMQKLIKEDTLVAKYYEYLEGQADLILEAPLLERKQIGRRLLSVSREALRRFTALGLLYRLSEEPKYLNRLVQEVKTVCEFSDWNPDHFLDVAEMALAVSLAIDWTAEQMDAETLALAKETLKTKALEASFADDYFWIDRDNNWNQVCHGSLVAASLVVAEQYPELATKVIQRAVENSPIALEVYGPDGGYPEGPGYWTYGTAFSCMTFSLMETGLNTDFGLSQIQGFLESATYKMMMATPSGRAYNYADNRTGGMDLSTYHLLSWFALQTQNAMYFDREGLYGELPSSVSQGDKFSRFSSVGFLWLCDLVERQAELKPDDLPSSGIWQGDNPVAVKRGDDGFYFGFKGGKGSVNHGNADAGSFILQWQGVDWSMDLGNQSYTPLEEVMGGKLWDRDQESPRWTLLSKNNFGHSTLTVNDALHEVDGFAPIQTFRAAEDSLYAQIDMSPVFGDRLQSASRSFQQKGASITITDQFVANSNTQSLTWQLLSRAEMTIEGKSVLLNQDGKEMLLEVLNEEAAEIKIVSLSPPPLPYDIQIPDLKRLEIRFQVAAFPAGKGQIKIRMTGQ
ncbi:MAG: heparinase II/III family protein [Bacteroidota bacterium]